MRDTPPHLLLTNYAMLEYLLLRPADMDLFEGDARRTAGGSSCSTRRTSTTARRRRRWRCCCGGSATGWPVDRPLRYIATSATVGDES